jgi:hypothetical protein
VLASDTPAAHSWPELAVIADAQLGLVTTGQLRHLGVSRSAIRWRTARTWRFVLPGVVATFTGPLTNRHRLVAAQLYAGPGAALAGPTAAVWHGVESARFESRVHVLVPAARRPPSTGHVVVGRTSRPDERAWRRGALTICSPPRAVVDAARAARSADGATAVVLEAVQRRIVTVPALRHELEAGARRDSAQLRAALRAAEGGAWSVPESDLAVAVALEPALPPMWLNPDLLTADGRRLPRPDGWFDDVALAVQVHSLSHHGTPDSWDGTVTSDGLLVEHGVVVLGVTPRRIRTDPDAVVRRILAAYRSAAARPRPPVVATPVGC